MLYFKKAFSEYRVINEIDMENRRQPVEMTNQEIKEYVQKIKNQEVERGNALRWLAANYRELSLHDLSLITALMDQSRVHYSLESEKYTIFLTSLEDFSN